MFFWQLQIKAAYTAITINFFQVEKKYQLFEMQPVD